MFVKTYIDLGVISTLQVVSLHGSAHVDFPKLN